MIALKKLRVLFGLIVVSASTTMLVGCGTAQIRTIAVQGTRANQGPTSVEIHNVRGDVRVIVDPKRTEPRITASFRYDSFVTRLTRERAFRAAPVAASYELRGDGVLLVVRTDAVRGNLPSLATDLTVRIPACADVTIRTAEGDVEVIGANGTVDIVADTNDGRSVSIVYRTDAAITGRVVIRTNSGNILFNPGDGSSGRFVLTSGSGGAEFDVKAGKVSDVVLSSNARWEGVLNGGENSITLHSDDGTVRVKVRRGPGRSHGF